MRSPPSKCSQSEVEMPLDRHDRMSSCSRTGTNIITSRIPMGDEKMSPHWSSSGPNSVSLEFNRKRQSIGQLRKFCQSQQPKLLLFSSFVWTVVVLLINCHIAPVSSAAIAVTNEPPSITVTNRTTTGGAAAAAPGVMSPSAIPSPIIRLPSNSLIKYTAYRDVSILHFQVPRDTRTLYYSFRAHEEFKSAFCEYFQ